MNPDIKAGNRMFYRHEHRGGYGYVTYDHARVKKVTPKRVTVETYPVSGGVKLRSVLPENLKPMAKGQILRFLIIQLDDALTGRGYDAAQKNAEQQKRLFEDVSVFLMEVESGSYYLSDGGYSRLLCNTINGVIGVDSISRREVKDRWNDPAVQAWVAELNALLMEVINSPPQ